MDERYTPDDGPPFTDWANVKVGDKISVNGYVDQVTSVRYSSGAPVITGYRQLNWWQRVLRQVTPRRWRKSLAIWGTNSPTYEVTIGDEKPSAGWDALKIEQLRNGFNRLT